MFLVDCPYLGPILIDDVLGRSLLHEKFWSALVVIPRLRIP